MSPEEGVASRLRAHGSAIPGLGRVDSAIHVAKALAPDRRRSVSVREIKGTPHSSSAAIDYVSIDHGRADVAVAEQLLDRSDVMACLEKVCSEGVPQGVAGGVFGYARHANRRGEGVLQDRLVQVMASALAGLGVDVVTPGWEDPLPGPLRPRAGILPLKRIRQGNIPKTAPKIGLVLGANARQVSLEGLDEPRGQHGDSVLAPLSVSDDDFSALEIDVLRSQTATLE